MGWVVDSLRRWRPLGWRAGRVTNRSSRRTRSNQLAPDPPVPPRGFRLASPCQRRRHSAGQRADDQCPCAAGPFGRLGFRAPFSVTAHADWPGCGALEHRKVMLKHRAQDRVSDAGHQARGLIHASSMACLPSHSLCGHAATTFEELGAKCSNHVRSHVVVRRVALSGLLDRLGSSALH
jgi:hypothetical protein